jgi:hypothetical protein
MGFMNFLFGLGIALVGIHYVLSRQEKINPYIISLFFLTCYCSHFVSLLILLIPVIALITYQRNLGLLRRMSVAFLPTLALLIHYYFSKEILTFSSSGIIQDGYLRSTWNMMLYFPAVLMPFHRIKHIFEPGLFENISNYAFSIFMHFSLLYCLIRIVIKHQSSIETIAFVLSAIIIFISPPYLGGLFNLGERFVFLLWILLATKLFLKINTPLLRNTILILSCIYALLSFGSLWSARVKFNSTDILANESQFSVFDTHGGSNPFTHFHYYDDILQNRAVPVFHHALLNYSGAQNSKPFDQ